MTDTTDCPPVRKLRDAMRAAGKQSSVEFEIACDEINRLYNQIQDSMNLMAKPLFKIEKEKK